MDIFESPEFLRSRWKYLPILAIFPILCQSGQSRHMAANPDNLSNSLSILAMSTNAYQSWQSLQMPVNPGNLSNSLSILTIFANLSQF
jgi:hypothetical protein